jgi:hypothetical protein
MSYLLIIVLLAWGAVYLFARQAGKSGAPK